MITLPIALIGFAFFPGLPSSRRPWFLTPEEHSRASSRLPKDHKQAGKLTFDVVKRTLKRNTFWFAVPIYVFLYVFAACPIDRDELTQEVPQDSRNVLDGLYGTVAQGGQ